MNVWSEEKINLIKSQYPGFEPVVDSLAKVANDGIAPGGFYRAVLENDLFGAHSNADVFNRQNIGTIISIVYMHFPAVAVGSRENLDSWLRYVREQKKND